MEAVWLEEIMLEFITAFVIAYGWGVLGISLGYHRGLSHRSFKLPLALEYFFVIGAYLVFEGGPIFWVASHRIHHRYSDQPGDPHSPKDGVWHSILGWMSKPIVNITEEQYRKIVPDLYRDPLYNWLHAGGNGRDGYLCLTINIVFRLGILALFGPWALLGNMLGSVGAFIAPLMVNSICHMPRFGYQNFKTTDLSQNVWFVAIASFGEGWHNNHHEFPQSARHGMKPWEYDFSYSVLSLLEKLGIARNVRLPKIALGTSTLHPLKPNTIDPARDLIADEPELNKALNQLSEAREAEATKAAEAAEAARAAQTSREIHEMKKIEPVSSGQQR